jgi:hypothetical protein
MSIREQWATFEHSHKAALIISGISAIVIVVLLWRVDALQGAEARAALAATNEKAAHDTTRMLKDSLGFQRLVIQQVQKSDAVDQELGEMRRALLQLGVTIAQRSVSNVAASTPTSQNASGTRFGTFDVDSTPYHLHAVVSLPVPPAKGAIDARFALDPFGLDARLGCTAKVNTLGMRDALLTVRPVDSLDRFIDWAKVAIHHVEQDPSVCPSPVLQRDLSADTRSRWSIFVGYGYTYPQPAARIELGVGLSKPLPCPAFLRKRLYGC